MLNKIEFYSVAFCGFIIISIVIYMIFKILSCIKIIIEDIEKLFHLRATDAHNFKKDMESSTNSLISKLLYEIKFNNDNNTHKKHNYDNLYNILKKIKDVSDSKLHDTMYDINAIRLAIYLFHNGDHNINGFNFLKVSCIGEKILAGSGVREKILLHSNIMANLYTSVYDDIFSIGRSIIFNSGETDQSSSLFISSTTKTKYSQVVCIYDNNNNIVGFILAEFDHEYNKAVADDEYTMIKCLCDKLSPIFSFTNYVELATNAEIEAIED